MAKAKVLIGAAAGYGIGFITSGILPAYISLLLPLLGVVGGLVFQRKQDKPRTSGGQIEEVSPAGAIENNGRSENRTESNEAAEPNRQEEKKEASEFDPLFEYMEVIQDMILSEGQKNNVDAEIVDKTITLITRLQRIIPQIKELHSGEINHMIKRLVMNDLNSLINPFLKLSTENKIKNRRLLLDGLKHINSKIDSIQQNIQQRDLLELQSKAELINSRYKNNEIY